MMKKHLLVPGTLLALLSTAPLAAQDGGLPVLDLGPGILSHAGDIALNQSLKNYYGGRRGGRSTNPNRFVPTTNRLAAAPAPRSAQAQSLRFGYQSTPALRKQAVAEFVARARKTQPEAVSLGQQLARHDYDRIWRGIAGRYGLSPNDTADALTAYTVLGWLIANGASDTNATAVRAARAQIAERSAANPQFTSATGRAKLGEEFKILFVVLHSGWQSAQREGTAGAYRNGVARMFQQQSGTDLQAMRLTSNGFVGG